RHAAGEQEPRFGALERGELVLGDPLGRVAVAAVFHAIDAAFEVVLELLRARERVRRRLEDRGRERVTRLGSRLAAVHGHRARAERPVPGIGGRAVLLRSGRAAPGAHRALRPERVLAGITAALSLVLITTPSGAPDRRGARWRGPPAPDRAAARRARCGEPA